ncbi:flagellar hook assembly protein FlgD [Roseomonas sp. OT10]|uniref:flagellar hook assembly protein FlgD n=1 Tax=Roseomonas cutis TaxID=2897332 RepID=UPI001E444109|nr:flagellar hook capping FlgD N-terminal domain-containing protein [Roseomonas sp. OT10]UFN48290.1 flagellar hook assembly protein FlgD [Roseomonas sp. OT10]
MATTAATAAASTTSAAAATAGKPVLSANFDTFLTLLTTQLKNQSPTDPLDTNQMTAQLVQFASVEQQIAMNGNLEKMIALDQAAQLTAAAPLMGRTVQVEGDRIALQDGVGRIGLPAAGEAAQAHVTIRSGSRVLREVDVPLGAAASTWSWDGKDANGNTLADGAYTVAVNGTARTGEAAPLSWTVIGTATAMERQNGTLKLMLGSAAYDFDKVRSVSGSN